MANDLLRADGRNADAMYVRGLCLYYEDNLDKAFSHFQQVLRLAPDHHKAKEVYKRAKLLKQKKDEGNAAFKASKLSEALSLYSEALEIDPLNKTTNAKLFFNRGTVAARVCSEHPWTSQAKFLLTLCLALFYRWANGNNPWTIVPLP